MTKKLIITTALLIAAFSIFAQGMPPEEVEDFLFETDELIDEAAPRFEGEDVPGEAVEMFEHAVELQEHAWNFFERRNFDQALRHSQMAREHLQHALRMLEEHGGEPGHEGLLELIDRNDDIIEELTPLVEESEREELIGMLDRAIELNEDAREAYDEGDMRHASRLAENARRTLDHIRRMLAGHGGGGGIEPDRIRDELERTDAVIEEVTEALGEDAPEEALDLLERANEIQEAAWEHFEEEDYREAMTLTHRARELAMRARRPVHEDRIAEHVEEQLEITDNVIERVTPLVEESGDEDAIDLLEDAVELQAEAREAFEEENYEEALRKTQNARRMAQRAAAMVEEFDATEIREAIDHTQELIDEAAPIIEESGDEHAMDLLERAIELQEEANEAFEEEEYREALAKTTAARNIVRRALALVTDDEE